MCVHVCVCVCVRVYLLCCLGEDVGGRVRESGFHHFDSSVVYVNRVRGGGRQILVINLLGSRLNLNLFYEKRGREEEGERERERE